jgi:hypothetical protein
VTGIGILINIGVADDVKKAIKKIWNAVHNQNAIHIKRMIMEHLKNITS